MDKDSYVRRSAGPLRLHHAEDGKLFVVGYGLWIEVKSEAEGKGLIEELEDQGFKLCV